jgi:hypothetical protein
MTLELFWSLLVRTQLYSSLPLHFAVDFENRSIRAYLYFLGLLNDSEICY